MQVSDDSVIPSANSWSRPHALRGGSRWIVIFMLGSLHLALTAGLSSFSARAFLVSHVGSFLLWQPVFRADRRISPLTVALIFLCGVGLFFFAGEWLIVLWISGLIALSGGRVFTAQMPRTRRFYLLVLAYLFILLLMWAVPVHLAKAPIPAVLAEAIRYGFLLFVLALAVMPLERDESEPTRVVDFVYALLLFLLSVVLTLGSVAFRDRFSDYYLALTATIMVAGVALLIFALLWNPGAGYGGFQTVFSRYLLSVGLPFETWLQQLAEGAEKEENPARFLTFAVHQLAQLPWVVGGEWKSPHASGTFGKTTHNAAIFSSHDLELKLFASIPFSPTLILHTRLLTRLLGEFYVAKRREETLRQNAYLQAVHETGARLTHDIKNLLQSLYSLAAAGQDLAPEQLNAYSGLVQRQLPALTKRLQLTLERLRGPADGAVAIMTPITEWWDSLKARYEGRDIEFVTSHALNNATVPRNVFDSVAENLLENARRKRLREPSIKIRAEVSSDETSGSRLLVTDTGAAVDKGVENRLFKHPVSNEGGTGIGLFQAHQQARQAGFDLVLVKNQVGHVCFALQALSSTRTAHHGS
jgi:signal transduction histidine kinase